MTTQYSLIAILRCLLMSLVFITSYAQGQIDLNNYSALRSSGSVPADFIRYCSQDHPDYVNKKEKDIIGVEKFNMISDFHLRQMFQSGKVIFGDPIGKYINSVADSLLASFPDLRKELRFYVCNSQVANAYASDQGIIFVNIGLIAHLENEAQLAFILAHEVTHYVRKHSMTIFSGKEEIFGKGKKKNGINQEGRQQPLFEKLMTLNHWSKELETEADMEGFSAYYRFSPYKLEEAVNAFNVLLYAEYPFTQAKFNYHVMETEDMIIPDEYILTSVDELTVDENEADSMSTHPNVRKRKNSILSIVDTLALKAGVSFLQSKEEFEYVRNLAKFEVVRQLLIDHNFEESLYCANDLLASFPDNQFLIRAITASIYGLSAYKQTGDASEYYGRVGKVKGEMKQVTNFARKFKNRDWSILAASYAWQAHMKFPKDEYLAKVADATLFTMVNDCDVNESWFYKKTYKEVQNERRLRGANPTYSVDEYGMRTGHVDAMDTTFTKFAFVEYLKDSAFSQKLHRLCKTHDSLQQMIINNPDYQMYSSDNNHVLEYINDGMQINHIVMANPVVYSMDVRKIPTVEYYQTIRNQFAYAESFPSASDETKIQVDLVNGHIIGQDSVDRINDIAIINEYIEERLTQKKNFVMLSVNSEMVQPVMQQYNTKYVGWSGNVSYRTKLQVGKNIVITFFCTIIPWGIPYAISCWKPWRTYYLNCLYDVNTSKMVAAKVTSNKSKLSRMRMSHNLRDYLRYLKDKHYGASHFYL